jgi:hypothetical protein
MAQGINKVFCLYEGKNQALIWSIMITIQIPVPSILPASAKQSEPVFTKEQPPVCLCHTYSGNKAASIPYRLKAVDC